MNSSGHKLPQSHEGMLGEQGGEVIVRGSGGIGDPVLEKHLSGTGAQGLVRSFDELRGGDIRPGGGRGV